MWMALLAEYPVLSALVGLATVACVGGLSALYYFQRSIIYPAAFPEGSRSKVMKPSQLGLPYEDVTLTTRDGVRITGYLIKQEDPAEAKTAPTVIYFHANAGNMGHRLPIADAFFRELGCNVFLLSYRGYGLSDGEPTERGLQTDAETALEFLQSRKDIGQEFVGFGQSLGGAVVIDLASKFPDAFKALILENTFTYLPDVIPHVMPIVSPFRILCTEKWNSERAIANVKCPILFLSGRMDEMIPPAHMDALLKAAVKARFKKLVSFPRGTHNDTVVQAGYMDAIREFWTQHVQRLASRRPNHDRHDYFYHGATELES